MRRRTKSQSPDAIRADFDALVQRRRKYRRAVIVAFASLLVFGMVAGQSFAEYRWLGSLFLLLAIWILNVMTPSIVCPQCSERLGNSIGRFCPECRSNRIVRREILGPDCAGCGRRFRRLTFKGWRIRCCTQCGALLDPDGRETGAFLRNRDSVL